MDELDRLEEKRRARASEARKAKIQQDMREIRRLQREEKEMEDRHRQMDQRKPIPRKTLMGCVRLLKSVVSADPALQGKRCVRPHVDPSM